MFGKSGAKAIGAVVMQTRTASGPGVASGLIWTEKAGREASGAPNAAGRIRGLFIEGAVSGDTDISVNGVIRGDVNVTGLTVDEDGVIEGGVVAERVEVRGRVVGDIRAEVIKLHPQAVVIGDLTYRQLSIEMGAEFQGACHQLPPPMGADELAVPAPPAPEGRAPPVLRLRAGRDAHRPNVALPEPTEALLN